MLWLGPMNPFESGVRRVVLVTHGLDMVRGRREFHAAGIETIAAPTHIARWGIDHPIELLPTASALHGSSLALYEMLGNLAFTLGLNRA